MDIRTRRAALGWSRKDLAQHAKVDASVIQLLELDLSNDDESRARVDQALAEAEKTASSAADSKTAPEDPERS